MSLLAVQHSYGAHLEPVQQLAPYLSGLDVSEALDGFTKLADKILTSPPLAMEQTSAFDDQSPSDLANHNQFDSYRRVSSPGGLSCSSSQWLSPSPSTTDFCSSSSSSSSPSSGANSPAPSDIYQPSNATSSSSSSYSSRSSYSSTTTTSGRTKTSNRRSPTESRRKNNATAAEKYRQKLKGRKCGLSEQLDEQLEKNARLRRQVEAKLTLYKEFVALLARQTNQDDRQLANLGARSLSLVLGELNSLPNVADVEQRLELHQHLQHFQWVLKQRSSIREQQQQLPPPTGFHLTKQVNDDDDDDDDESQMLEYDFFADRFSLVAH